MVNSRRFQVAVVAPKDALVSLLGAIEKRVSQELDGVELIACPYEANEPSPALASADAVVLGVRVERAADDAVLVALLDSVKRLRGPQRSRALVAITLWGARAEELARRAPHPMLVAGLTPASGHVLDRIRSAVASEARDHRARGSREAQDLAKALALAEVALAAAKAREQAVETRLRERESILSRSEKAHVDVARVAQNATTRVSTLEGELEAARAVTRKAGVARDEAMRHASELAAKLDKTEANVQALRQESERTRSALAQAGQKLAGAEARLLALDEAAARLRAQVEIAVRENAAERARAAGAEHVLATTELEVKRLGDALEQSLAHALKAAALEGRAVSEARELVRSLEEKLARSGRDHDDLVGEMNDARGRLRSTETRAAEAERRFTDAEQEVAQVRAQLAAETRAAVEASWKRDAEVAELRAELGTRDARCGELELALRLSRMDQRVRQQELAELTEAHEEATARRDEVIEGGAAAARRIQSLEEAMEAEHIDAQHLHAKHERRVRDLVEALARATAACATATSQVGTLEVVVAEGERVRRAAEELGDEREAALQGLRGELDAARADTVRAERARVDLMAELAGAQRRLVGIEAVLAERDADLVALRARTAEVELALVEREKLIGEREALVAERDAQLTELGRRTAKVEAQVEAGGSRNRELAQAVDDARRSLTQNEAARQLQERTIAERDQHILTLDGDLAKRDVLIAALDARIAALEAAHAEALQKERARIEHALGELRAAQSRAADLEAEVAERQAVVSLRDVAIAARDELIGANVQELEAVGATLNQRDREIDALGADLALRDASIDALTARTDALARMLLARDEAVTHLESGSAAQAALLEERAARIAANEVALTATRTALAEREARLAERQDLLVTLEEARELLQRERDSAQAAERRAREDLESGARRLEEAIKVHHSAVDALRSDLGATSSGLEGARRDLAAARDEQKRLASVLQDERTASKALAAELEVQRASGQRLSLDLCALNADRGALVEKLAGKRAEGLTEAAQLEAAREESVEEKRRATALEGLLSDALAERAESSRRLDRLRAELTTARDATDGSEAFNRTLRTTLAAAEARQIELQAELTMLGARIRDREEELRLRIEAHDELAGQLRRVEERGEERDIALLGTTFEAVSEREEREARLREIKELRAGLRQAEKELAAREMTLLERDEQVADHDRVAATRAQALDLLLGELRRSGSSVASSIRRIDGVRSSSVEEVEEAEEDDDDDRRLRRLEALLTPLGYAFDVAAATTPRPGAYVRLAIEATTVAVKR